MVKLINNEVQILHYSVEEKEDVLRQLHHIAHPCFLILTHVLVVQKVNTALILQKYPRVSELYPHLCKWQKAQWN